MKAHLLRELANVFMRDSAKVAHDCLCMQRDCEDCVAWPPLRPTDEELRESERLRATAVELYERADAAEPIATFQRAAWERFEWVAFERARG